MQLYDAVLHDEVCGLIYPMTTNDFDKFLFKKFEFTYLLAYILK